MQGLEVLLGAVFWFAALAIPVAVTVAALSLRRHRGRHPHGRHGIVLLDVTIALALLAVATITLLPVPDYLTGVEWGVQTRPLASIRQMLAPAVDSSIAMRIVGFNVVLFVPFGFLLMLRTGRWPTTVATACAVSIVLETMQAVLPLGRTANVDDVILNTLGAAIGALAGWAVLHLRRGTRASRSAQPREKTAD